VKVRARYTGAGGDGEYSNFSNPVIV
jgi:hypothetical protein